MDEERAPRSAFDTIRIGQHDGNDRPIVDVYACEASRYAVYQTPSRVVILFAEDPLIQRAQRQRLARLATFRSQIDGDLAEWRGRNSRFSRLPQSARQFDLRVGSALIEALEGDADTGLSILKQIQTDIDGEKQSRARLSYLLWTFATAAAFLLTALLIYGKVDGIKTFAPAHARSILHAIIAGVLGAVYSIAMGIERRELRNDQRRLDHITDALVRISIGALAAFILETFLLTGTIRIGFGSTADMAAGAAAADGVHSTLWPVELIAGFLAGFAERLVPDLLNSYTIRPTEPDPPAPPPRTDSGPATSPTTTSAADQNETSTPTDVEAPEAPSEEEDVDGCVDHAAADPVTSDEMLPAAAGGVARE